MPRPWRGVSRHSVSRAIPEFCAWWECMSHTCFIRLPVSAWPTDARMHPLGGVPGCLLRCKGHLGDLRHYVGYPRLWLPVLRALRTLTAPTQAQHAALAGDAPRCVAAVRARLVAFRTHDAIRNDAAVLVADTVVAWVDHARMRLRERARVPLGLRHLSDSS